MKRAFVLLLAFLVVQIFYGCGDSGKMSVISPSGNNEIDFFLSNNGVPGYLVSHNSEIVIDSSHLGFEFKDQPPLKSGLKVISRTETTFSEKWEMPWGEQRYVENKYNELIVKLQETETPNRKLNIYFRAYDDGAAFRYEFPEQENADTVIILDENTEFALTGDHTCWWIPGDWDIYEHLYNTTKFSEIDALSAQKYANLAQSYVPENAVNTPVTMKTGNGLYLSFHEANLTDYAGMTLKIDPENLRMTSELVGSKPFGWKVKRALPFKTPWRMIQIADEAKELIESRLVLNLNDPNKLGDVSWFKPKKYVGIWWEMHIDVARWDYASGKHGATTENAKRYIDFAAENGITGLLVEGWNTGLEHWIGFEDREGIFDFVTPYPDYDLEEVNRYANSKGVELIMHHETSAAPRTYEQQLDTAYSLMRRLGIHSVKTGYVGPIIPKGEYHHGQWMVNHYRKVLETAAKYKIAVNAHEPIKATGIRRTYPNAIAREGARGQEFNAWSQDGGNPPEHLTILPFTRLLAGPMDFTPGVFDISLPTKPNNQINTTLAQQLALYVVVYSPIQMACDLPQNYEGQPAFQFIRDVGVDWEQSVALDGEIGDFVVIAREERNTERWFVGAVTDENAREIKISFNFLEPGKIYRAVFYQDAENADWKTNPKSIDIIENEITAESVKTVRLAPGGGLAVSLFPEK